MLQNLLSAAFVIGALRVDRKLFFLIFQPEMFFILTFCMLGNFTCFFFHLLIFFKINIFQKIQEYPMVFLKEFFGKC